MGYFSCNSESSIIVCDPYNWDKKKNKSLCSLTKKKKKKKKKNTTPSIRRFSYSDLESATNGFSSQSFLGKGSHGSVYKAVLDDGKLVVAVKKMSSAAAAADDAHGNGYVSPADNEVEILSRVRSPCFVNLVGYSLDSRDNKLIVVEFMPNGSLYDLLHSHPRPPGWAKRVRFALQIAKAVHTLHSSNPPVIHRDIKSSNVLIDTGRNARLGDFGLALRGNVEDVRIRSTPPAGTLGYLDPGYIAPENLSAKSDVFSFGILLLEMISGRHAIDLNYSPPSVVDWAMPIIKHGDFIALCDTRINPPGDISVIRKLCVLAARCVCSVAEKRPSMEEVVECLRVASKKVSKASSPIWQNLRKQMKKQSLSIADEGSAFDVMEEVLKSPTQEGRTMSSTRNNRRVTSGGEPSVDSGRERSGAVGYRISRAKSIGSIYEVMLGSDHKNFLQNRLPVPRMRKGVAVRMPVVTFSKSRSLGVLRSTCLVRDNQRGYVFQLVKSTDQVKGLDEKHGAQQSPCRFLLNGE